MAPTCALQAALDGPHRGNISQYKIGQRKKERFQLKSKALLIGNSDGIGLAATKRLFASGRDIIGVSRSKSPITNKSYHHHVADVSDSHFPELLAGPALSDSLNLCIYFVGIGELLDPMDMREEGIVIDVNLTGMVRTAAAVIPQVVRSGVGGR